MSDAAVRPGTGRALRSVLWALVAAATCASVAAAQDTAAVGRAAAPASVRAATAAPTAPLARMLDFNMWVSPWRA
jgi:hypothetical protein